MKIFFERCACAAMVLLSYSLGVKNERYFPGDRSWPQNGEEIYWILLIILTLFAVNYYKIRDYFFK